MSAEPLVRAAARGTRLHSGGMSDARLRQWLHRASVAEICGRHEPFDRALEGVLYAPQVAAITAEQEAEALRFAARHGLHPAWQRERMVARQLLAEGKLALVSANPLASESIAPFQLDGREHRSVWSFYQSLKSRDGDPRPRQGGRRTTFRYDGLEIGVNSVEHGVLVARATEAKVLAHEHVRRALAATGTARLYMGEVNSQALGRYMPFALMVMRFRLTR